MECVLDVDSAGREPQKQAAKNYHYDQPRNPELFRFEPIPLSFEPVEPGRCAPVLYSSAVRDMIDYSLRSCVERGVTVRRCKNCGRWFPQTGRVSAEYCERPVSTVSSAAARSARSGSGRKSRPTTPSSRRTARSIKSASRGSKPAASPMSSSTPGANRPEKKKMRPGDHLAGGISTVAPRLENIKLRGRRMSGRVFFVYIASVNLSCWALRSCREMV